MMWITIIHEMGERKHYPFFKIQLKVWNAKCTHKWYRMAEISLCEHVEFTSDLSSFPYSCGQSYSWLLTSPASRDRASSRSAALSRGRAGGKRWVRSIAGGGAGVMVEVSPAVPLWRVTPIRLEMLSHLTLLDTASTLHHPPLSPFPLLCSPCSCELIGYFIQHRLHNSHISFVGVIIARAPEATWAKNKLRDDT